MNILKKLSSITRKTLKAKTLHKSWISFNSNRYRLQKKLGQSLSMTSLSLFQFEFSTRLLSLSRFPTFPRFNKLFSSSKFFFPSCVSLPHKFFLSERPITENRLEATNLKPRDSNESTFNEQNQYFPLTFEPWLNYEWKNYDGKVIFSRKKAIRVEPKLSFVVLLAL